MFERYVRYDIDIASAIVERVQRLNRDDKLTCLKEIATVGSSLIQSRLVGDLG